MSVVLPSTPASGFDRFSIDSDLSLPADSFSAEAPTASGFIGALPTDKVTLKAGLAASGGPVNIGFLENAVVDEYELSVGRDSQRTTMRGRDPINVLLDRTVNRRYARLPLRETIDAVADGTETTVTTLTGRFRASDVAKDLAAIAGLALSFEARDYELLEDFDASGRIIDVFRRLVEPFNQVEPFRVDITVEGSTIIVRPRQINPVADFTFSVRDSRISELTLRRRNPRFMKFGRVQLTGKRISAGIDEVDGGIGAGGSFVTTGGTFRETNVSEVFAPPPETVTTTINEFRMPDRALLSSQKTVVVDGVVESDEIIRNEWEAPVFDEGRAVNQPIQKSQEVSTFGIPQGETEFQQIKQVNTDFTYDSKKFLIGARTIEKKLNLKSGELEPSELIVRTIHESGTLQVEEITEVYRFNSKDNRFILRTRDTQKSAGHRPGGPGRGRPIVVTKTETQANTGESVPIRLERIISTDPEAIDVDFDNVHMNEADLAFIMDQFVQSNAKWRREVSFTGVAMPLLRRGVVIQLTGLTSEAGVAIPLQPALITAFDLTFDESGNRPSMIARINAIFWSDT